MCEVVLNMKGRFSNNEYEIKYNSPLAIFSLPIFFIPILLLPPSDLQWMHHFVQLCPLEMDTNPSPTRWYGPGLNDDTILEVDCCVIPQKLSIASPPPNKKYNIHLKVTGRSRI